MPQLERCFRGQNLLRGAKIFGLVYFSPSSPMISEKKKKSSCQIGLRLSEFSVDVRKIKGHLAKLFYLSPSFLSIYKKKGHHLETAVKGRGVWLDMLGILGGSNFYLGGCRSFLLPRSCGLVNTNPEHDNISRRY